jgi:hypothetical protein
MAKQAKPRRGHSAKQQAGAARIEAASNMAREIEARRDELIARSRERFAAQAEIAVDPDYVAVLLPIKDAERMQLGLADLLCWVRGFKAARPDSDTLPLGEYEARDLRDAINRALDKKRPIDTTADRFPF